MNKNFTYFPHHPFHVENQSEAHGVVSVKFAPMEKWPCFYHLLYTDGRFSLFCYVNYVRSTIMFYYDVTTDHQDSTESDDWMLHCTPDRRWMLHQCANSRQPFS